MTDEKDTAEDVIADVIDEARSEGANDATLTELRARLEAIETRQTAAPAEPVDLSPLREMIDGLGSRFDAFGSRLDAIETSRVEAKTDATDDDADEPEIAPQIDVSAATKSAVKTERAPFAPHFLFRKFGRR